MEYMIDEYAGVIMGIITYSMLAIFINVFVGVING